MGRKTEILSQEREDAPGDCAGQESKDDPTKSKLTVTGLVGSNPIFEIVDVRHDGARPFRGVQHAHKQRL